MGGQGARCLAASRAAGPSSRGYAHFGDPSPAAAGGGLLALPGFGRNEVQSDSPSSRLTGGTVRLGGPRRPQKGMPFLDPRCLPCETSQKTILVPPRVKTRLLPSSTRGGTRIKRRKGEPTRRHTLPAACDRINLPRARAKRARAADISATGRPESLQAKDGNLCPLPAITAARSVSPPGVPVLNSSACAKSLPESPPNARKKPKFLSFACKDFDISFYGTPL